MEESEKMTALKKAYAEIILNTAKEAATRIMVSERRSNQLVHDLSSTKDEALRLCLRLKQNMDFQLNEAEMKSLHQQRKIEELEAQLQEAEDIVSNLRGELNEAHMKIEEMEKNQIHNSPIMMEKSASEEGTSEAVLASQAKGLSNAANGDYITIDSIEKDGYVGAPDVPSGIVRSKITELYRNGCTQRIHAYEGNLLSGHFPLASELDDMEDEKTIRDDQISERICRNPLLAAGIVGNKLVNVEEVKNDIRRRKAQVCKSLRNKKRSAVRFRRISMSLHNSLPPLVNEVSSDLPSFQTCLPVSHDMLDDDDDDDDDDKVSPLTAPSNISEMGVLSEHVPSVQGDDEVAEAHTNAIDEDSEVASSLVLIRQQSGSGDCLDVPHSIPELEINNVSSTNLDAEEQNSGEDFPVFPPKNMVVKYTFQRKRKKEALSSDDSSLLTQENPAKRKMVKKQNSSPESSKSSTGAESSRDSRRMAQVARQLISLSEKKWNR